MQDRAFNKPSPLLLASLSALAPFSVDTYLPAIPAIAASYGDPVGMIQLSLSSFLLGFAGGQLLGGPLSDHYGRRKIAVLGILIFILSTIPIIFSSSYLVLIPFRFLQAFGSGMVAVVPAGIVRDTYEGKKVAAVLAFISFIMLGAPLVAPLMGSLLLLTPFGWRSIFTFLLIYGIALQIVVMFRLGESREAKPGHVALRSVLKDYWGIVSSREAISLILPISFSFAAMFSFLTGSSFVYIDFFGVSESEYSLYFAINILNMIALNRLNPLLLRRFESSQILTLGIALQALAALALFLFAMYHPRLHFLVACIAIIVGSLGLIVSNGMTCCLALFPEKSGTAAAVIGMLNFSIGGLIGVFVSVLHDGSYWPMVICMLISVLLSNVIYGSRKFMGFQMA